MTEDVRAARAKFLNQRQQKLDKEKVENGIDDRQEFITGLNQPPARRATDGGVPGTKEQNPLELAEKEAGDEGEDMDTDGVPTSANTVAEIKAYLDAQGVNYDGVTRKDDLLALIETEQ